MFRLSTSQSIRFRASNLHSLSVFLSSALLSAGSRFHLQHTVSHLKLSACVFC